MTSLPSELPFAALLAYSPQGTSEVSIRSRGVRDRIKRGDRKLLVYAAEKAREQHADGRLGDTLGPDVALIPVPRSAPLKRGSLWPALEVCRHLVDVGLGAMIVECVERVDAVPKSAFARPGERPSIERHLATLRANEPDLPFEPASITVVDDVVTKGATLIAAASRAAEIFPVAEIRAFALLRTRGLVPDVTEILDPRTGRIWSEGASVYREP